MGNRSSQQQKQSATSHQSATEAVSNRSSQQLATEAVGSQQQKQSAISNRSNQQQKQSATEATSNQQQNQVSKKRSRAEKRECNPSTSFHSSPWHLPPLSNPSFQLKEQKSIFRWKRRERGPDCSNAWSAMRGPASMGSLMPTQTTPPTSTTLTTGYSRAVSTESGSSTERCSTTVATPRRTTSGLTGRTTARTCPQTLSTRHPAYGTLATRRTCTGTRSTCTSTSTSWVTRSLPTRTHPCSTTTTGPSRSS